MKILLFFALCYIMLYNGKIKRLKDLKSSRNLFFKFFVCVYLKNNL